MTSRAPAQLVRAPPRGPPLAARPSAAATGPLPPPPCRRQIYGAEAGRKPKQLWGGSRAVFIAVDRS